MLYGGHTAASFRTVRATAAGNGRENQITLEALANKSERDQRGHGLGEWWKPRLRLLQPTPVYLFLSASIG